MATDIAGIDVTKPDTATQDVPTCINYEKETRACLVTTFGQEHHLTGEHKIPFGDIAARPAPGFAGRIYLNSETKEVERDSGAGWIALAFYTKRIKVVSYVGDGNINKALIGLGFQPKVVFIIPITGAGDMVVRTSTFTAANSHQIGVPATIVDGIVSLDADGFTVGITVNTNAVSYTAICLTDL